MGWHGTCYAAESVPSRKSLCHNDLGGGPRKCLILNYLRGWSELARTVPTSVTGEVISVSVATGELSLARWRLQLSRALQEHLGQLALRATNVSQRASGDVED